MSYQFLSRLMLRTPMFSHGQYAVRNLPKVLLQPVFQKALYLANPTFYYLLETKAFQHSRLTEKEQQTLLKYYNRMCFRATPLGLFAAFSVANWSEDDKVELNEKALLHTRFDHKVEVAISQIVSLPHVLDQHYLLNPCLYKVYKEYRFVKTTAPINGEKLVFAVESLDKNVLTARLVKFFGNTPHSGHQITQFIIAAADCNNEEAVDYLQFLIEAQVLRSEYSINITGQSYLDRLLNYKDAGENTNVLSAITAQLYNTTVSSENLKQIAVKVSDLSADAASGINLYYSVAERPVESGGVDIALQQQLLEALQVLHKLTNNQVNPNLQEFITKFKARYDLQKVPLLHAVDPEIGIGYSSITRNANNLVPQGAWKKASSAGNTQIQWSAVHKLLMELWGSGASGPGGKIVLTEELVNSIAVDQHQILPPSTAIMFRRSGELLQIESAGGVSALGLIGRFSIFSKEVEAVCHEIAQIEQAANPNVIFAELAQLSNLHVDNINRRKHAYQYEIPINAISTLPPGRQLALSDLWLSVVNDELILESANKKMRVIPRHSSAYNVVNNELGVFRLLCDIQAQGLKASLTFSLESLFPGLRYYPRVQYKNVVFCLAVWNLGDAFITDLKKAKNQEEELELFNNLKAEWKFPALIALNKADQFLVFNTEKPAEVGFLLASIKTLKTLRLQEYLPDNRGLVYSDNGPLAAQYVALACRKQEVYKGIESNKKSALYHLRRTHVPGSEWLYLKLYCDQSFADLLLTKRILPLVKQLQKDGIVKQWFFIRYTDTDYHLRIRMKLHDSSKSDHVLQTFKNKLFDVVHYRLIKEYLADSYQPELERYGHDIIHLVEQYFFASSNLVASFIAKSSPGTAFDLYAFALITVNSLADAFIKDQYQKLAFYNQMSAAFYKEFADDKMLRVEMDNTYRTYKTHIHNVFLNQKYLQNLRIKMLHNKFVKAMATLLKALQFAAENRKRQILADLIHMHVNRTFSTRQRQQELLIYYFLAKHTQAVNAMQKAKV